MASLTTLSVPSGLITTPWCLNAAFTFDYKPAKCANSTQSSSDFQSFCCAGDIIDTTQDLYHWPSLDNRTFDLQNLVCCLVPGTGSQQGGLQPIQTARSSCTQGAPTPLLSLAATSMGNAAYYPVTYTSASFAVESGSTIYGDYKPIETPNCLYVYTKTGVQMTKITVPVAEVSTMPLTTDQFSHTYGRNTTISSRSKTTSSGSFKATSSAMTPDTTVLSGTVLPSNSATSAVAASSTTSAAASARFGDGLPWLVAAMLSLIAAAGV